MQRTFEIDELLRHIISFLDTRSAANAARVNSTWTPLATAVAWEIVDGSVFKTLGEHAFSGNELSLNVSVHPISSLCSVHCSAVGTRV